MTRAIVVANQKGGVGKTTTVVNLGAALAEKNYRILMIDMDPQGGLSASFGFNPYDVPRSAYSLLMYPHISMARVLRPLSGQMALVPASIDLATAEVQLAGYPDRVLRLRHALARSRIPFDFILIDTPPSLGILTANCLAAATEVLIPVQCEYLAMRGVRALLDTIRRTKQSFNPDLKILGVVATMYDPDDQLAQEVTEELKAVFGPRMFKTLIHKSSIVAEAPIAGQSVLRYAPKHQVAADYRALAEEIAGDRR